MSLKYSNTQHCTNQPTYPTNQPMQHHTTRHKTTTKFMNGFKASSFLNMCHNKMTHCAMEQRGPENQKTARLPASQPASETTSVMTTATTTTFNGATKNTKRPNKVTPHLNTAWAAKKKERDIAERHSHENKLNYWQMLGKIFTILRNEIKGSSLKN